MKIKHRNYRSIQERIIRALDKGEDDYYIGDVLYNDKILVSYRGYSAILIPKDRFYLDKNKLLTLHTEIIKDRVETISKNPTKLFYYGENEYSYFTWKSLYLFRHEDDDLITYIDESLTKDLFDINNLKNIELFTLKDSNIDPVLVFDNKQFIGTICPVHCKD